MMQLSKTVPERAARLVCAAVVAGLVLIPVAPVLAEPPDLEALAAQLDETREAGGVPGMAVAVVKNDEVIFARGFGVRSVEDVAPVDEHTLFAIGSSTKAFTSLLIGLLVDERELGYGDRVQAHLPELEFYDPYADREMRVIDLLSHTSGLARGDFLWLGSQYDRDEILRRIRYLEPSWGLRRHFGYQNIMFLAAGQLAAKKFGVSWDDLVKEKIFAPLGMERSNTSVVDLAGVENVAQPHAETEEGETVVVPYRNIDNVAPAGSINSSAADMAQWLRLQLNEGKIGDEQIISSRTLYHMHEPQSIAGGTDATQSFGDASHFVLYGMGWFLQDFRGKKVVHHGGTIDGMRAMVGFMPEEELGVVILTNLNRNALPSPLLFDIFDHFLGAAEEETWSAKALKLQEAAEENDEEDAPERVSGTAPSRPLEEYVGTYEDDFYGAFDIEFRDGKLRFKRGDLAGVLEHWHYDVFNVVINTASPGKQRIQFGLGLDGKVDRARIGDEEEFFNRRPRELDTSGAVALSVDQMRAYVGKYALESSPLSATVELLDGELRVTIPGQSSYVLVSLGPDRFTLAGIPAQVTIELTFHREDGAISALEIEQTPGGHFMLPRASD